MSCDTKAGAHYSELAHVIQQAFHSYVLTSLRRFLRQYIHGKGLSQELALDEDKCASLALLYIKVDGM